MIRSYKGVTPQFPDTCYIDDSAQLIGDVILREHASIWMNSVLRGDVHPILVGHYSNIQVKLDYRDGLVDFMYDPKRVRHLRDSYP
jgi:carbonic anhydrase/acetyltransferase-like protein (isoleucine patch superfamily)